MEGSRSAGLLTTPVSPLFDSSINYTQQDLKDKIICLAMVKNQNNPAALPPAPCAAVASVAPRTMRAVVITSAAFLPILSHISPTTTCPMIAPV